MFGTTLEDYLNTTNQKVVTKEITNYNKMQNGRIKEMRIRARASSALGPMPNEDKVLKVKPFDINKSFINVEEKK